MVPKFRPRLPEVARNKIKSGGMHRNKKVRARSAEKQNLQKQLRDVF